MKLRNMSAIAAAGVTDEEYEYAFASGIVLRSGYVERY